MPNTPDTVPPQEQSVSADPGTTLWNLQTQTPEWVPLSAAQEKLASGGYREYGASGVNVAQGIGGPGIQSAAQAAHTIAAGGTVVDTRAQEALKSRQAATLATFDNSGDKALAVADGFVSGLSGGILEGVPVSDNILATAARETNSRANSGYKSLGELAALAATVIAPESVLKYTPLGAANEVFSATSKGVRTVLGDGILATGAADAAAGAASSLALSSANQVGRAVQGKPVHGNAIVDDVGLGTIIAGTLGLAGGYFAKASGKIKNAAEEIQAAARFDESAKPIMGAVADVSNAWSAAHTDSAARMRALDKLVDSGLLEGSMPAEDWLAARHEALAAADKSRKTLNKLAGTEAPGEIAAKLADLASNGNAKATQKLYRAFDDYGTKVSALHDAMLPTSFDHAHLGEVIGDLDLGIHPTDHPAQRAEQMAASGASAEEVNRFLEEYYPNEAPMEPGRAERAEQATGAVSPRAKAKPRGEAPIEEQSVAPGEQTRDIGLRGPTKNIRPVAEYAPDINAPTGEAVGSDLAAAVKQSRIPVPNSAAKAQGMLFGTAEEAGLKAQGILLDQYRATAPVRPTDLGATVQGAIDRLTAATGGRLGTPEARDLARKLGMDIGAIQGPVSSKLADLWALHKMSEALAEVAGKTSKTGFMAKALKGGMVSAGGKLGYNAAGSFGAGASRSLLGGAISTALQGAAGLSAVAGRFRQSAINGMARVLTPVGRRALSLGAIQHVVSETYAPDEPVTTDYETKARQLRQVIQAPDTIRKRVESSLRDVGAIDPVGYQSAVEATMTRLKNLAAHLPQGTSVSVFSKTMAPRQSAIDEWHAYEGITQNRDLVFSYIRAGSMPDVVREAVQEQHPEFIEELRNYVIENPAAIDRAPHKVKVALSKLLGVHLVPEADPAFVLRMQESYDEARQKQQQQQQAMQGAAAIKAGIPTMGQLLGVPSVGAH